jgi:hypothetical protein
MKLDRDKFSEDESKSNPMVVAVKYEDCPINGICFFVVVGFGTVTNRCEYLESKETEETAICKYKKN